MTANAGRIIRITRRVIYTQDELDDIADHYAGFAAHEIADITRLRSGLPRLTQTFQQITGEVAFAIRCAVDRLPEEAPLIQPYTPAHLRRREHYALLRGDRES